MEDFFARVGYVVCVALALGVSAIVWAWVLNRWLAAARLTVMVACWAFNQDRLKLLLGLKPGKAPYCYACDRPGPYVVPQSGRAALRRVHER